MPSLATWLLDHVDLLPLSDEPVTPGGAILRVLYAPTFHPWVVVTLRAFGDLAELELQSDGLTERVLLDPPHALPLLDLLPAPLVAFDRNSRDGIAALAERWDGREYIVGEISNPSPEGDAPAHQLLRRVLDFSAERISAPRHRVALAEIRRYLDDLVPPPATRRARRR